MPVASCVVFCAGRLPSSATRVEAVEVLQEFEPDDGVEVGADDSRLSESLWGGVSQVAEETAFIPNTCATTNPSTSRENRCGRSRSATFRCACPAMTRDRWVVSDWTCRGLRDGLRELSDREIGLTTSPRWQRILLIGREGDARSGQPCRTHAAFSPESRPGCLQDHERQVVLLRHAAGERGGVGDHAIDDRRGGFARVPGERFQQPMEPELLTMAPFFGP